jgi:hypothetical protein
MSNNPMDNDSVRDGITAMMLGVTDEWFDDPCRPLDPIIFACNEEAARRVMMWINKHHPMSTEEMAQEKPMSYYIALEQDKQQVSEHETGVVKVQE